MKRGRPPKGSSTIKSNRVTIYVKDEYLEILNRAKKENTNLSKFFINKLQEEFGEKKVEATNVRKNTILYSFSEKYKRECAINGEKFSELPKLYFEGGINEIFLEYAEIGPTLTIVNVRKEITLDFVPENQQQIVEELQKQKGDTHP